MRRSTGSFGSDENRGGNNGFNNQRNNNSGNYQPGTSRNTRRINFSPSDISPENWVDIICIGLMLIFIISIICNWRVFSDGLFINVLFPIISVGAKIGAIAAGIASAVGAIYLRFSRRRRWWWF